ncbi:hypothetical protein C0Q70_14366 [Pomacea canaliculata]|uniref:Uncharacterized protein n=1 Tax=Pomacea canaliculata TaxID=400727 RepID=A0A2T7NZT6_POMCA|nr:hypothetical protein C0Q70_14366 [Pomacea canaliculata]
MQKLLEPPSDDDDGRIEELRTGSLTDKEKGVPSYARRLLEYPNGRVRIAALALYSRGNQSRANTQAHHQRVRSSATTGAPSLLAPPTASRAKAGLRLKAAQWATRRTNVCRRIVAPPTPLRAVKCLLSGA